MESIKQTTLNDSFEKHNKKLKDKELQKNENEKDQSENEQSSDEGDDEGQEINFPRDNAQDLYQFLHRELNNLSNMEDNQKRKFALIKMYQILVYAKNKAPNKVYQELLPMIQKPLFKRLSDKVEKSRELVSLIIKEFFLRSDDITMSIPYLMPILIERLNCENLEGIDGLPEQMRPPINQKPQVMINTPETSEEVRVVLAEIVTIIVSSTVFECLRAYVDQIVNIIRALCMDPYSGVIMEGCQAMSEFAQNGGDQLLHFSEAMGRSLFTAFVDKHAKVRIAGLKALYHVFFCGAFKYSANLMEHLIGFRDPNIVPIKDFYESTTKLNYFAMMVADRSPIVREHFYKTVAQMLIKLPDKKDHEPRMFPYLISGLYDQVESIQESTFELIEELGKNYEEEYESDIRELKQFGYKPEWQLDGAIRDSDLVLPYPFIHRPCLGARILVRSYVRRYLKAIYKEVSDWIQDNRERSSHLLVCSIIYTEDFMTQYLDHLLVALYKAILDNENKVVKKMIPLCFEMLGRYCGPQSYGSLIISAIRNELASFYPHTQSGSLKAFGYLLKGTIDILPKGFNLTRIESVLNEFIKSINEIILDQLDTELATHLIESLTVIVQTLIKKQEQGVDISLIHQNLKDIFYMIIRCLGIFNNYKLVNKQDPENISIQKKKCVSLLNNLTEISKKSETDFFDQYVVTFFKEQFNDQESLEKARDWTMQSHKWRMFYIVFDLLDQKQLQYYIDSNATTTIFEKVYQILYSCLENGESKNYEVKRVVLHTLISSFINKSLSFLTDKTSSKYLQLLNQASKINWQKQDEKSKELQYVLSQHKELFYCEGVNLSKENISVFNEIMIGMEIFYKEKLEKTKSETLQIILKYLNTYNEQVFSKIKINEQQDELSRCTFLPKLTNDLIPLLTDYHDSVREGAQLVLKCIVEKLLPKQIGFTSQQQDLLQMLRANVSQGWGGVMTTQLKEAAEMEEQLIKHIFDDGHNYLKQIIAIMIDETHGRDNLVFIIKEFNEKTPFLLLNDFRIAYATNSLRRIEILKELISNM